MHCHKCGAVLPNGAKFCEKCGTPVLNKPENTSNTGGVHPDNVKTTSPSPSVNNSSTYVKRIVWGLVIAAFIGFGIYGSQDKQATTTNNDAIASFTSSDTDSSDQQAIQQLQTAYTNATESATKLNILKNLAYAYSSSNDDAKALSTFQQALTYTSQGSLDYYLITGEIDLLQNDPAGAIKNYNSAYKIDPSDFQVNNALALFYLDINSVSLTYDDYTKAIAYAKAADSENHSDSTQENLAIAYYYNGNYQQANSLLLPLNLNNHPQAALYIGLSYAGENDSTNAKIYFQKAIDLGVKIPQQVTDYINSH